MGSKQAVVIEMIVQMETIFNAWQKTCIDCGRSSEELARATDGLHLAKALQDELNENLALIAYMGRDIEGNPNKFRLNYFNGSVPLYVFKGES